VRAFGARSGAGRGDGGRLVGRLDGPLAPLPLPRTASLCSSGVRAFGARSGAGRGDGGRLVGRLDGSRKERKKSSLRLLHEGPRLSRVLLAPSTERE